MTKTTAELAKILRDLNKIPDAKRDDDWYGEFLDTVPQAHYVLSANDPVKAPDGFYYFNLSLLPEDPKIKIFDTVTFDDDMLEDCLERCAGIVIYPDLECKQDPVWILSYGEIHSYQNFESFAGDPEDLEEMVDAEEENPPSAAPENISTDAPDDEFIHPGARRFMKNFFDGLGLNGIGITMIRDRSQAPSRALVLSLVEEDFKSVEELEDALNTVSWLRPPNRPVLLDFGLDSDAFVPLA